MSNSCENASFSRKENPRNLQKKIRNFFKNWLKLLLGCSVIDFLRCLTVCGWCSFLFGWHVHEKGCIKFFPYLLELLPARSVIAFSHFFFFFFFFLNLFFNMFRIFCSFFFYFLVLFSAWFVFVFFLFFFFFLCFLKIISNTLRMLSTSYILSYISPVFQKDLLELYTPLCLGHPDCDCTAHHPRRYLQVILF